MAELTRRHVVVVAGGISHERDVSLRSGRRVADSLTGYGWDVDLRDADASLLPTLRETRPDVVWPALHGASGEDGALRGILEALDIPFVGSRSTSARLAWDKPTASALVAREGVRTPRSVTLSHDVFRELGAVGVLESIAGEHPVPLAVKPARGGSAQGVTLVDDVDDLPRAMVTAYTYCDDVVVEQLIRGTEVAVGIIDTGDGPVALSAVEIVPRNGIYGFEARYNAGETTFYTPARLSEGDAAAASAAAVAAHTALGLRHISRVDIIVDAAGTPWFLEANVLPGLTETSLVPQALSASGFDLGWTYAELAEQAIRDHHLLILVHGSVPRGTSVLRMILASAVASAGAALLLGEAVHAAAAARAWRLPARVTPGSTGVVVVLGFQDHGARANMVNRWRARIAVRTARRAEALRATVTILCNGGAVHGQIPEADLLARFIRDGLGWDGPLVTEASSRSTWENVANSLPSLEHADWVAFASNGLHAEKARLYLRRQRPDIAARSVPADDYRFGEMIPVKPIFAAVGVAKLFSAFHVKHR